MVDTCWIMLVLENCDSYMHRNSSFKMKSDGGSGQQPVLETRSLSNHVAKAPNRATSEVPLDRARLAVQTPPRSSRPRNGAAAPARHPNSVNLCIVLAEVSRKNAELETSFQKKYSTQQVGWKDYEFY